MRRGGVAQICMQVRSGPGLVTKLSVDHESVAAVLVLAGTTGVDTCSGECVDTILEADYDLCVNSPKRLSQRGWVRVVRAGVGGLSRSIRRCDTHQLVADDCDLERVGARGWPGFAGVGQPHLGLETSLRPQFQRGAEPATKRGANRRPLAGMLIDLDPREIDAVS